MSHIAAFVGHSFVDADQKVVQSILNCLNVIREIHPSFTWEHATHPEPSGVDEKVLRLFANKNLFIAICTKKEQVLAASEIKTIPFFNGYFFARNAIQWKTSDWIIQEIGVAIGRNMRIIILLEDGVKLPGSLQGNLEYITFRREMPDACFTALMGMIAAITPRPDNVAAIRVEKTENRDSTATDTEDETNSEGPPPDIDWITPNDTWDATQYRFAYMIALREQGAEVSERISRAFHDSRFGGDAAIRNQWEAWKLLCKTRNGDANAFTGLLQFVDASPNDPVIRETLSRAYIDFGEHALAAAEFALASQSAADPKEGLRFLKRQVEQLSLAKEHDAIPAILEKMRSTVLRNRQGEEEILFAELGLAKANGRDAIVIGCLERLVELEPANADHRFELAYKYSDIGENSLAAMHYSRIPAAARSGIAWNNLGAAFAALDLPCKAIESYVKAEEHGETIATSNLALARMGAGFQKEAVTALEAALKGENPHKNVLTSLNRARALPEEEADKQKQLFEKAATKSDFHRCYGNSIARPFPGSIDGVWNGPKCALAIQVAGDQFIATGTFEQKNNGLLAMAMMGLRTENPTAQIEPWIFDVKYSGQILGRSVTGELSQIKQGEQRKANSLLTGENPTKVYMWLDEDGRTLHVMQQADGHQPSFYKIERAD